MFVPAWLFEDIMYIQAYAGDRFVYHTGSVNTIDEGIKGFQANLKKHGQIIVGEPEMVSYLNGNNEIIFVIIYNSLSKLEYLEYMYEKSVGNNTRFQAE